jgi:protein-disulfide isomerase
MKTVVTQTLRILAIPLIAALSTAGSAQSGKQNWNIVTTVTPAGNHVLGNPGAAVKLVEFVSYTCPHCAHFEEQADSAMRATYVSQGKLSVEVRSFLRDPVDLTVALLTNCGPPAKFFGNHSAFMRGQDKWITPLGTAGPLEKQRWSTGPFATRTRAIATDFGFYEIMKTRGYERPAIDRCLADEAKAKRLAAGTDEAQQFGVAGTPSFTLNGELLAGTHDWASLYPLIRARM